jgi:hypothetical protein
MPGGVARRRLESLVASFAARLGSSPFPPHLTLLPGIDGRSESVAAIARALATRLRPLTVRLESIEGSEEHFRCLIAVAVLDDPLREAHGAAARAFAREPDPSFLPHVSLVYGSLAPESKRALAAEAAPAAAIEFRAERLHVWRTEGPVEDWRELEAVCLGCS